MSTPEDDLLNQESFKLLRKFMNSLHELLNYVAENPGLTLPAQHHAKMREAWSLVGPRFEEVDHNLKPEPYSSQSLELAQSLDDVGLLGSQLEFKVSIFTQGYIELKEISAPEEKDVKTPRGKFWRRLFKPVLKAADVILGSLSKVILVTEIIKEYKESIEAGTELGDVIADRLE